jgi:hypothetical protein
VTGDDDRTEIAEIACAGCGKVFPTWHREDGFADCDEHQGWLTAPRIAQ